MKSRNSTGWVNAITCSKEISAIPNSPTTLDWIQIDSFKPHRTKNIYFSATTQQRSTAPYRTQEPSMNDLNSFQIKNDGNYDKSFIDNSTTSSSSHTTVYFRNIEENLLKHITEADAVFGAVAWLTSHSILNALAEKENVSIIVQKEDFLRPDIGTKSNFKNILRKKYSNLKCNLIRYSFDNILNSVSVSSDPSISPVRCVGNHNLEKKPAFPRMHNKFLIFAKVVVDKKKNDIEKITPYAVWTGSFN